MLDEKKNFSEAAEWMEKFLDNPKLDVEKDKEDILAMRVRLVAIGNIYVLGDGVQEDIPRAITLFNRFKDDKVVSLNREVHYILKAQFHLGYAYYHQKSTEHANAIAAFKKFLANVEMGLKKANLNIEDLDNQDQKWVKEEYYHATHYIGSIYADSPSIQDNITKTNKYLSEAKKIKERLNIEDL